MASQYAQEMMMSYMFVVFEQTSSSHKAVESCTQRILIEGEYSGIDHSTTTTSSSYWSTLELARE